MAEGNNRKAIIDFVITHPNVSSKEIEEGLQSRL